MKPIASIPAAEAPVAPAAAAPKKAAAGPATSFDSLLKGKASAAAAKTEAAAEAQPAIEEKPQEQTDDAEKKDASDAEQQNNPDALLLSSCLAAWQNLPPPVPLTPLPKGTIGTGEIVESKSSENVTNSPSGGKNVMGVTALAIPTGPSGPTVTASGSPKAPAPLGAATILPPTPAPTEAATDSPAAPAQSAAASELPAAPQPLETTATIPPAAAAPASPGAAPAVPASPAPSAPAAAAVAAPGVKLPAAAPVSKPSKIANTAEIKMAKVTVSRVEVPRLATDGIPVAKEQRAMSDPVFSNPAKPAPAAFAEGESSPHATHEVGHETAAGTAATESSAGQNEPQSGSSSSGQQEHAAPESFTLPAGLDIVHDSATPPAEAKAAASDTAQVIREIERAVDRMRAQGSQQMEVRLPMHDGNEVVVKLRIEQGEVKATFQSGSEELRQALETGWSQQTQSASERAGKTATTVLESPALQNSAGGFQHSRDQRQHDTGSAADEFAPKLPAQTNKRAAEAPRPALVKTPAASMQIYA